MKSLVLILMASMTLFSTSSFTPAEDPGNPTYTEEFRFYTDDGCGTYLVYGTLTIRQNAGGGGLFSYEGTAVNVETGEETPLHVRSTGNDSGNGFGFVTNGVFPGVMQFHYQMRVKFEPTFKIHINDFSHCVKGGQH